MARIGAATQYGDNHESQGGQAAMLYQTLWAIQDHRPEVAEAQKALYAALRSSGTLSPRLVELVRLRVAFHNQCRTCMAVRYQPDVVPEELVCSLEQPDDGPDLTNAERVALHFADLFATSHLAIDDSVYDALREHFQEGELVELGVWCALMVGFGRLTATWHVVEQLPESFQPSPATAIVTPWGHEELVIGTTRP